MCTPNKVSTRLKRTSTRLATGNWPSASVNAPCFTAADLQHQFSWRARLHRPAKSNPRRAQSGKPNRSRNRIGAIRRREQPCKRSRFQHDIAGAVETALSSPPIRPAMLNAPCSSAITKVLSARVTVFSFRQAKVSPFSARRTMMLPCSLSASNTCMGWPSSSIT